VLPQIAYTAPPEPYQRQLAVDFVSTAVGFEPGMPMGGGGQIAVSDVLGNEQYVFSIANDAQRFGNFWDGWQGGVTYWNQSRRLHYGVGIFRLTEIYDEELDDVRREKRVGMTAVVRYPFNRFTRIETSLLVRHASDHRLQAGAFENVDLVSNYLTLTHDTARWTLMGPAVGTRVSLTGGVTRDMTRHQGDFVTLAGELRQYRMLVPAVISASRVRAVTSVGRDAQRSYLGGYYSLRGYERRALSGDQTLLLQQELRFPLLRGLALQFPGPMRFPTIRGILFGDAGWTWSRVVDQQAGAIGTGVAMGGLYFPELRVNYVWITSDYRHYPRRPRTEFVIGFGF
jgi:outer membrane protein assembly factor BamA